MNRDNDLDIDEATEGEAVRRLARDPAVLSAIIDAHPDPHAVAVLKAIAPVIAKAHRRLLVLEALYRSGRLIHARPHR
jgi:hypothetical protein